MSKWKDWIAQATKYTLDALYPPSCFACDEPTQNTLLCEECLTLLEPFHPENCCPTCLTESECLCVLNLNPPAFADAAYRAAFPLLPLIDDPALAKPLAALAAQSYLAKNHPLPTSILPVSRRDFAKHFAHFLGVPLKPSAAPLYVCPLFDPALIPPCASTFALLA